MSSSPGDSTGSPSTHIALTAGAFRRVSATSRFSRERSQPATSSASARGPSTLSFSIPPISGQSSASRRRQGSVRENAMSETATLSNSSSRQRVGLRDVAPLRRVDDETVGDADDLGEGHASPAGLAAPAAEDGQVGDEQRQHDRARVVGGGASQPELDHLREHLAREALELEVLQLHARLDLRLAPRARDQEDRAGGMALEQAGEGRARLRAPLGRAPHDVRHRARAQVGHAVVGLARPQASQLALDVGDDAHRSS